MNTDFDLDDPFNPPDDLAENEDHQALVKSYHALNNALKHRGAPHGNRNALKHGFYSRFYKQAERDAILKRQDNLDLSEEIDAVRVYVRRLIERDDHQLTVFDYQEILRTLSLAFLSLTRLIRAQDSVTPPMDLAALLRGSMGVVLQEARSHPPLVNRPHPSEPPSPSPDEDELNALN